MTTPEIQKALARELWAMQSRLLDAESVRVVLDVGAWRGHRATWYAKAFPAATVYAMEPEPNAYALLVARAEMEPRIVPVQAAAGVTDGTARFYVNDTPDTASLLPVSVGFAATGRIHAAGAIDVPTVRLDGFCARHGIERVDVLKLDVQGAELQALDGARGLFERGAVGLVMAELNFWRYYDGQCWWYEVGAWLARYGYELVAIAPEWWEGRVKFCDGLFARGLS